MSRKKIKKKHPAPLPPPPPGGGGGGGGEGTNSLSKSVLLINIESEEEIVFESLGKCVKFFSSQGLPVSHTTIVKRLDTNIPYRGYICKTVASRVK